MVEKFYWIYEPLMEALARAKLLYAPLLLTLIQAMGIAFLISSVSFGAEGNDLWRRLFCIALSFGLSIAVRFFNRDRRCSEQATTLLTFISCAAFSSIFSLAAGQACIVQSSRFILFFKVRLHLSVLLNLANCAVLAGYATVVHRRIATAAVYADANGIFAHIGGSMGAILREGRLVLILGSATGLGLLLAGVLVLMPIFDTFQFMLQLGLFYNSTLELFTNFILMNLSNWAYTTITGILAAMLVYNCSVMPYEDRERLAGLRAGRFALHKYSTAPPGTSQMPAKQLSDYIEAELGEANSILDSIEAAAVRYENSAFVNVPQINRNCSTKIRSCDLGSYVSACWAYQVAMFVLPLQYSAVSVSLGRILSYFMRSQSQAVRHEAALQRVPAMFEGLLARERLLEKRCGIDLESWRLASLLKRLSGL